MGTVPETYDPRGRNIEYRRTSSGDDGVHVVRNHQRSTISAVLASSSARLYLCFNELKKEVHHIDEMNHGHPSDDCSSTW